VAAGQREVRVKHARQTVAAASRCNARQLAASAVAALPVITPLLFSKRTPSPPRHQTHPVPSFLRPILATRVALLSPSSRCGFQLFASAREAAVFAGARLSSWHLCLAGELASSSQPHAALFFALSFSQSGPSLPCLHRILCSCKRLAIHSRSVSTWVSKSTSWAAAMTVRP